MRTVLWTLPALATVILFLYLPIVQNFWFSLFKFSAFMPGHRFVGLANYRQAWHDSVFWRAMFNNTAYAVVSVLFQVFFALALAAMLEQTVGKRLRGFLRTVYFIPATIATTIAGILFTFIYHPQFGLLNHLLKLVGLGSLQHAWLGQPHTAIWSVIAMSQWQNFGYTTMLFIVAIQSVPKELYEAAYCDGAGPIRTFVSITFHMVREMTTLMIIVTISGAFLVFNEIMATTAGGPANSTQTLGTWLYQSAFMNDDMGYAAAIASVIFLVTFIAALIQLLHARARRVES
jgi:raffinose/stachyose/melibiose transport system permease protein